MQRLVVVVLTYLTLFAALAWARPSPEKAAMTPEAMRKLATHVVQGEVLRIYETKEVDGPWEYTRYIAEMKVGEVEKGKGVAADDLVYPRWFHRSWRRGVAPPSGSGHYGWVPRVGQTARAYLAKNATDGFTRENFDGGFSVLVPNGFEQLKLEPKKR